MNLFSCRKNLFYISFRNNVQIKCCIGPSEKQQDTQGIQEYPYYPGGYGETDMGMKETDLGGGYVNKAGPMEDEDESHQQPIRSHVRYDTQPEPIRNLERSPHHGPAKVDNDANSEPIRSRDSHDAHTESIQEDNRPYSLPQPTIDENRHHGLQQRVRDSNSYEVEHSPASPQDISPRANPIRAEDYFLPDNARIENPNPAVV